MSVNSQKVDLLHSNSNGAKSLLEDCELFYTSFVEKSIDFSAQISKISYENCIQPYQERWRERPDETRQPGGS